MDFSKISPQLFGAFKTEGGAHKRPQDVKFWMGWDSQYDEGRGRQEWAGVQPSTYKFLDPNREAYQVALKRMPNTLIVLRNWHFDDDEGKRWNELMANPTAAGEAIIDRWIALCDTMDVDYSRTVCMLWNEPHEWEGDAAKRNLVTATLAAMRRRKKLRPQMGLLLINLGVGWPGNHDTETVKDTPPDWSVYDAIYKEMLIDKIDILGLHEYWMKEGPRVHYGWMAGRFTKCPWNVPIIIGEAAYSGAVGKPQGSVPTALQGWAIYNISGLTAEKYMAQMIAYNEMCRADPRIIGWQCYLVDYANEEWKAKDIEPMYGLIRANLGRFAPRAQTFQWGRATPPVVIPPPPIVVPKPPPPVTPPPAPVTTLTGKMIKVAPNDGTTYVFGQAPNGATVYFAWRGNDAIAGIQAGPHSGYENWKPGYYSIPLYVRGATPCVGDWDVWASVAGKTSPRVQFHTDGRGGKSNQVEINFTLTTVTPPVVVPPIVVPPVEPPPVVVTPGATSGMLQHPLASVTITQYFGVNEAAYKVYKIRGHNGIDYRAAVGQPVMATADGVVAWSDTDTNYGEYIRVWHKGLGCHTFYAHLSKRSVAKGATVRKGQVIGLSGASGVNGNTGKPNPAHLHYEIRICDAKGVYIPTLGFLSGQVDPLGLVPYINRAAAPGGGSTTYLPFVTK